jgi:hypothetical protein
MALKASAARVFAGLLLTSLTLPAVAGPAVLELYTSEGCSSCPPAEKLIEELASRSDVLPLAFHVDYWDSLGWRDRFALPESTQRQEQSARTLRLSTVGTPQIIVNGRTVIWGAARSEVERAIQSVRSRREIQIDRVGKELTLRTQRGESSVALALDIVGYLPRAVTAIGRGENAGRTLTEINVVRSIQRIAGPDSGGAWHVSLDGLPPDAPCLALLLQEPNGAIVASQAISRSERSCAAAPGAKRLQSPHNENPHCNPPDAGVPAAACTGQLVLRTSAEATAGPESFRFSERVGDR